MILYVNDAPLVIPMWVKDVTSFRRWSESETFPEEGTFWWLQGEVWVDMSKEQIFSHLLVKGEFYRVLSQLVLEMDLGLFLPDGLLFTNEEADISGKPDGTFISHESREQEGVILSPGKDGGFVEVIGSPDMVLEVVSDSSVDKDWVVLRQAYWTAGVQEYWLVDVREAITFDILRRTKRGFSASRKEEGWVKSNVFGRSFRLTQQTDRFGTPQYRLESK